jgi:hypothetical protein
MTKASAPVVGTDKESKFHSVMRDFLSLQEWQDELKVDQESGVVSLDTGVGLGDHNGRLIIEAADKIEVIDAFLYFRDLRCKPAKKMEMSWLFQKIFGTRNFSFGRLELIEVEGEGLHIRWRHRVDFEGSAPSGKSVRMLIAPGWEMMAEIADCIAAVALTKQTAEEAFAEWEEARRAAEEGEKEAPKEL